MSAKNALAIGVRIRYTSGDRCTIKSECTGYPGEVIMEKGKEGTIVGFSDSRTPLVLWDAANWRIYLDIQVRGFFPFLWTIYLDRGSTWLNSFESGIWAHRITPIKHS